MLPVLKHGRIVWVFNWAYLFSPPKQGDIVVFSQGSEEFVKRVERVSGEEVFLKGDNPDDSLDSRKLGSIKVKDVLGRVLL